MRKAFKIALGAMAMAASLAACSSSDEWGGVVTNDGTENGKAVVSFAVGGFEASTSGFTRAGLEADGKAMTDLWVFDFADGKQVQSKHLTDNMTALSLTMDYGVHILYFVASRGTDAVVDSAAHTITWGKCSDTFYKSYPLTVSKQTDAQTVTLSRVASRLKITIKDALPSGMAQLVVTPTNWYHGLDYVSGLATGNISNAAITTDIPSNFIGQTDIAVSMFAIGGDWQTDAAVDAQDKDGTSLGKTSLNGVKMSRNVSNNYSGRLFSDVPSFSLALEDKAWTDNKGEW